MSNVMPVLGIGFLSNPLFFQSVTIFVLTIYTLVLDKKNTVRLCDMVYETSHVTSAFEKKELLRESTHGMRR